MVQSENILKVENLYVYYDNVNIVRNISFDLKKQEFLGIVGESGCGKTTLLRALMMLKRRGNSMKGRLLFQGKDLTKFSEEELRILRGEGISMIPQNAFAAMDSTKTISSFFHETVQMHSSQKVARKDSDRLASDLMKKLLLQDTERILKSYPFELSGGMCQRVMIAAAMLNSPKLILGDEPTSALDVTSQLQVIRELELLKREYDISMIMISHNVGVISRIADTIAIMYGGRMVEYGTRDDIIKDSVHPYTKALLAAVPDREGNISKGLPGLPPVFEEGMSSCPFAPRCAYCQKRCETQLPEDVTLGGRHRVQCFRAKELQNGTA